MAAPRKGNKGTVAQKAAVPLGDSLMSMNDEINKIGQAVHQAALAAQELEKLHADATERVAKLEEKDKLARAAQEKLDVASREVAELEQKKTKLTAEIEQIVKRFKGE